MKYYQFKEKRDGLEKRTNFISETDEVTLSQTFLDKDYAEKVDEKDYRYYKIYDSVEFDEAVSNFQPSENDIFL